MSAKKKCAVCLEGSAELGGDPLCSKCWDNAPADEYGHNLEVIEWAAKRARQFERKRNKVKVTT